MTEAEILPPLKPARTAYRDELNFAEFPLAALADTVPEGQKTLVYTDTIFDRGRNEPVTRKLTIAASHEHGLPTALDDEVILGLVQLTSRSNFADKKVHFSRYELIKELNWRDEAKSYERVEQSLKRWLGVTLYYDRAWWSKEESCWVDESFHILEQVTLFDRERRERRARARPGDALAGKSSFVWNEVVFNSFKSGYLKQIDFDLYKRLRSPISKRMYRFLDKRFYHRKRLEFDLREFACEKIGLSRNYHNGEIKRRLAPALEELEAAAFLARLAPEERFISPCRGEWKVVFVAAAGAERADDEVPAAKRRGEPDLASELVAFGIHASAAALLVREHEAPLIREKIAFVRDLVARKDKRISKNPAGLLIAAIRGDYAVPTPAKSRGAEAVTAAAPRMQAAPERGRPANDDRAAIEAYWAGLSEADRSGLEARAVANANGFVARQYHDGKGTGGTLFLAARQAIIDAEVRRELRRAEQE
jgi:hypothetical protein